MRTLNVNLNAAAARFDLTGRTGTYWREQHKNWRFRVHDLINDPKSSHFAAFIYIILMGLVLLSSVVLCLGTLPEFKDNDEIKSIEWACAIAFSVELILRLVSWQDSWCKMLISGTLYVDVLSVVPFFMVQGIEMSSTVDEVGSGMLGEEKNNGMQIIGILRSAPVEKLDGQKRLGRGACAEARPRAPAPPRPRLPAPFHHPYALG
jgi:hypothetical protein